MYSVEISINSGAWTQVEVVSISPFSLSVEKDQNFKRLGWGEIQMKNNPNTSGELFQDILNTSYLYMIEIKVTLGSFSATGYFSKNDCSFDYNRRIIKVTPTISDEYTKFLETWETEVDFNDYIFYSNPININVPFREVTTLHDWRYDGQYGTALIKENDEWVGNGEFDAYFNTGGDPNISSISDPTIGFTSYVGSYTLQQRIDILLGNDYGDYVLSSVTINESKTITTWLTKKRYLHCLTEFTREVIIVPDTDADPVGYNMREAIFFNGEACHKWTRTPLGLDAQGYIDNNLWTMGAIETVNLTTPQVVYRSQTSKIDFLEDGIKQTVASPMTLKEMLNYYLVNTDAEFADKEVVSTFFFNDNEGSISLLEGREGSNYVTLNKNKLNNIVAFNTNDIVVLDEGNENLTKNFSIKTILEDLAVLFNVFWFFDSNGNLRIEHIRYLDIAKQSTVIDNNNLLDYTENWAYDKSNMYSEITYKQTNAKNINFTDNKIEYSAIVSNTRNKQIKKTYNTSVLSTDLGYAVLNPSDVNDGIILAIIDDTRTVINSDGAIDGINQVNGELAMSRLLYEYHRYEGTWEVGEINGVTKEFLNTQRTKTSGELTLKGINDSMFFTSPLGIGILESGTIDLDKQLTKIKLRYRYNTTPESDTFALMAEQSLDFYEAESLLIDLGIAGQASSYIISDPTYYSFSASGGNRIFSITGVDGIDWTATIDQSWVSIVYPELVYANLAAFPATGTVGNLYKATDTGLYYIWELSAYNEVLPAELTYISGVGNGQVELSTITNPNVAYRYATLEITTSDSARSVDLSQKFNTPNSYFDIIYFDTPDVHLDSGLGTMSYSIKNLGFADTRTITITTKNSSGTVISTTTESLALAYLESRVFYSDFGDYPGTFTKTLDTEDESQDSTYTVYHT